MYLQWLSYCQFHIQRLLQTQPRVFVALIASGVAIIIGFMTFLHQSQRAETAKREWQAITHHKTPSRKTSRPLASQQTALPVFNSVQLINALNSIGEESKLRLDEISFSLDDNGIQPYLRYHATLTVSARYPAIRGYAERVRVALSNVSLDSIACTREDISATDLTCELAFSAFYKKDGHG